MFVSYAQNFEDVILWRALKHVENGFYIDIGAHHPINDSVSYAFYQRGWRGVHVEPVATYAAALRRERPDELVIEAVVGETTGEVDFFEIASTGLSTADEVLAKQFSADYSVKTVRTKGVQLSAVLDGHKQHDIYWLKIDVEGAEESVIRSWTPSKVRPWVVVVEAVDPISHEDVSDRWEPELLSLGYDFVYYDGLNRFYLSKAHSELRQNFAAGPNVFDDFTLSGTQSSSFAAQVNDRANQANARANQADARANQADARANQADARANQADTEVERLQQKIQILNNQLNEIYQSKSWRFTRPFRTLRRSISKRVQKLHRKAPIALDREAR